MNSFTTEQLTKEAEREVAFRTRVYNRMVSKGTMKAQQAEHLINLMREIARRLREEAELEKGQEKLL